MPAWIIQLLVLFVVPIGAFIVKTGTDKAVTELRKHTRLKDLAYIAQVSGDALTAALQSSGGKVDAAALADAKESARAVVTAALPAITQGEKPAQFAVAIDRFSGVQISRRSSSHALAILESEQVIVQSLWCCMNDSTASDAFTW